MFYGLKTNEIISGEDIQDYFYKTSPEDLDCIISTLVDHILAGDFEAFWNNFSYPVHGGKIDPRPVFFFQYLEYIKRQQSLQRILSPDDRNAVTPLDTDL